MKDELKKKDEQKLEEMQQEINAADADEADEAEEAASESAESENEETQEPQDEAAAQIEKLTAELKEKEDRVLRLQADFENFRRRTSKEKEELSAYVVLGLDPYRYLAMPRLFAFLTMIPCLTAISNALALIGGWIVCVLALDITTYTYSTGMQYLFENLDLWAGIIKSIVFGTIIFVLAYYHGTHSKPGAHGVGLATMSVVVSSCLMILVSDFILDAFLFF